MPKWEGLTHVNGGGARIISGIKASRNASCPTFSSELLEPTVSMFHINVDYEFTLGNNRPIKRQLSSMLSSPR
ncbi:hypothetical protein Y032_0065g3685 [Ancylostoma ceylanicum]|uniref:Uncharacterized protein n=1 Tax=Ancylostoma ceylanicum TaxID=53326 RepID=A0A016U260_9BILA|nr:hypothetical protein Y032_0065g3685 [Ancylostoma ceylanicum]